MVAALSAGTDGHREGRVWPAPGRPRGRVPFARLGPRAVDHGRAGRRLAGLPGPPRRPGPARAAPTSGASRWRWVARRGGGPAVPQPGRRGGRPGRTGDGPRHRVHPDRGARRPRARRGGPAVGPAGLAGADRGRPGRRRLDRPALHRPDRGRPGAGPVLRADQREGAGRPPGGAAAGGGLLPRRPDLLRRARVGPRGAVLHQPRAGRRRRRLPGQQWPWPRLPATAARTVGGGRRRRLRAVRPGPRAGRDGRPEPHGHPGHQCRGAHRARGRWCGPTASPGLSRGTG